MSVCRLDTVANELASCGSLNVLKEHLKRSSFVSFNAKWLAKNISLMVVNVAQH